MANNFEDYSEVIEVLARFERKRDTAGHDHAKWKMVNEALRLLSHELLIERSFLEKNSEPKKGRADEEMADLLRRYNILNREETELDRREVDISLADKMRKRPRRE